MRLLKITFCALAIVAGMIGSASAATTLEFWQFWTDPSIKPVIKQMVTEFEAANPDIKVNLTDLTWANGHEKIVIALSSGTGPDVLELGSDWIAQFAWSGHLADISKEIADDSADYQGWSMATYENKVYARPWFLGTRVLFGNRDLLAKTELGEQYVPANWSQFLTAVKQVHELGDDIYGWGSNVPEKHRLYKKVLPFIWSNGVDIFSPDENEYCLLASDKSLEALTFYKALHTEYGFVANQRGIEDAFLQGKIGFIISGDWLLKRIENEQSSFNLLSTFIPGPRMPGRSFLGGEFLAINEASENKEAALKFIEWFSSPANQVKFCIANRTANPSSREAQSDAYFTDNIHIQTFIKQIGLAKHPPVHPNWVLMETAIEDAVEQILFGEDDEVFAEPMRQARIKIDAFNKMKKK